MNMRENGACPNYPLTKKPIYFSGDSSWTLLIYNYIKIIQKRRIIKYEIINSNPCV